MTKFQVIKVTPSVCSQPTFAITPLEILNATPRYYGQKLKAKNDWSDQGHLFIL